MDSDIILSRAREYLAAEKNDVFRSEVEQLVSAGAADELNDRFYTDLEFGTGGLRGVIGGGFNRMNTCVVQRATQGVANYIVKNAGSAGAAVVIAYDSRRYSGTFALDAAMVLCGNGIRTFLFSGLRPTPELSFAVRYLKATAGIVITASHNPAEYNGYKVYWSDGGQIVPPHDTGIIREVRAVSEIRSVAREKAVSEKLLVMVDDEIDRAYIDTVKKQSIRPDLVSAKGGELTVVYSPLHGSGAMPVSRVLSEMGIEVLFVPEQKEPDGAFPTVKYPNPEEAGAMSMGLALGRKVSADIVMATDPDADRLGIAARGENGFELVSGNRLGVLLADYIFSSRAELGTLPSKPVFIKTIVTTGLQSLIAREYRVRCFDVLTGFKYIAEKIRQFETGDSGSEYVFGGEESYGYLVGSSVRDKDAVSAAAMTAEMALYHKSRGQTLLERLGQIFRKYGYFEEIQVSKYLKGERGSEIMSSLMKSLRESPPETFAGIPVARLKDYDRSTVRYMRTGEEKSEIDLPKSDVLQFILSDGSVITVRPSGTEPKIKFYASFCSEPGQAVDEAKKAVGRKIEDVKRQINEIIGG
jgi:phosphoglucomutase